MKEFIARALAITRQVDRLQPVLLLSARLYVSMIFFRSGLLKLADWSSTLALFHDTYKVPLLSPDLAAWVGTFGEVVFPVMIVCGLAGRFGAAALFVVNVMAVVSYPDLFGFECPAGLDSHYYWGAILLMLVVFGPGKLSLDRLLETRFLRRSS